MTWVPERAAIGFALGYVPIQFFLTKDSFNLIRDAMAQVALTAANRLAGNLRQRRNSPQKQPSSENGMGFFIFARRFLEIQSGECKTFGMH